MKLTHLSRKLGTLTLSLVILFGGFSVATAGSSGKNTAAHIKANIDKYEGKKVSIDVVYLRDIQEKSGVEGIDLLAAATIDEDERARGGGMLVIADADDHDKLIRRYGTNVERSNRSVETKSLRGTVRMFEPEKGRPVIYLDLTEEGFEPKTENLGALKIGYKGLMGGKRGKFLR